MSSYGTSLTAIAIWPCSVGFVERWLRTSCPCVTWFSAWCARPKSVAGFDEHRLGPQLAHHRRHELLLIRDAAEIGAVADAVADTQELQRLDALQRVRARR